MVQMVREGSGGGKPPNCTDFTAEFGVSRRTVARDLDFLRDEERAPLEYDEARHGFRLTDETYSLPPVSITRREAFSFGLARKLLAHYEGCSTSSQPKPTARHVRMPFAYPALLLVILPYPVGFTSPHYILGNILETKRVTLFVGARSLSRSRSR
ncbi:MAG: hypothetical protein FJ225_13160 [Lentisphaerae bacterium]|nr:hypothetical protein [Lentisphaerota bacterium]